MRRALQMLVVWLWVGNACGWAQTLVGGSAGDDAPARNGFAEVLRSNLRATGSASRIARKDAPDAAPGTLAEPVLGELEMFVGESRVLPARGVSRIAVGNGSILTAAALDGREVILFANGVGTSSLFVWHGDGHYQRIKVNIVPGDTERHAREIAAFLAGIPKARTTVVGASIIVEGDELSDFDIVKIDTLAKRYPQIVNFTNRVGWEQMVLMDVKVVEFPTSVLREIGLKWSPAVGAAPAAVWQPLRLVAQLNALAQEGKATVLAEPQLSARNGAKASFLAGGEVPYTVSNRDGVSVHFRPYGVRLDITPQVDRNGVIRATIHSEVSSIDRSVSTANGPGLLSRKTETEFNVHSGQTLVLSGLLQREQSVDLDKLPWLADLPVLGALFRSQRFQNKETELVVFVTPSLVQAESQGNLQRVQQATQRLTERLGPAPHLSDPLQPTPTPTGGPAPRQSPSAAVQGRSPLWWLEMPDGSRVALDAP